MHGTQMAGRKKLPAPITLAPTAESTVHDRRASDLPLNAIVAPVTVRDPYGQNGEQIEVLRSLRDDPLAHLHARKMIDDAQLLAGRKWQALYEASGIGGVRAIDPTKEAVDGGRFPDALTDRQRSAVKAMQVLGRCLGREGECLVRDVLGWGYTMERAAAVRRLSGAREVLYLGRRFRECLETMAVELGFSMRKWI